MVSGILPSQLGVVHRASLRFYRLICADSKVLDRARELRHVPDFGPAEVLADA